MPTVLITGSNRGLGLEFARQYAEDGWQVIATCRDPKKAKALQELAEAHSNVRIEKLDVGHMAAITSIANKLKGAGIDVLINNAGIASGLQSTLASEFGYDEVSQRFGTIDPEAWAKVLRINTIAPVMVTQAFLQHLRRAANSKVIMLSSRLGSLAAINAPDDIAYRSSKTALNAAMRCLASSLLAEKIIVMSLNPGWVQTDMGTADANLTPNISVSGMRKVIAALTLEQSGQFLRYDGTTVPW